MSELVLLLFRIMFSYSLIWIMEVLVSIYIINVAADLQSVKTKFVNPLGYGCVCKAENFKFGLKRYTWKWTYMIFIYQHNNNCASVDNFNDLVQLYFAFASVPLSNTLLWSKYKYSLLSFFWKCLQNYILNYWGQVAKISSVKWVIIG